MMKILVVDDNPLNQKLMKEMLEEYGICDVAHDGHTALGLFKKSLQEGTGYDLVCLDIQIPGMDGQQVLQQMRALQAQEMVHTKTKVIMCTSLDDSENIMEAFTKGNCDAYLTKPVSREKLHYHLQKINLA